MVTTSPAGINCGTDVAAGSTRSNNGLASFSFTDSTLTVGTTQIKAVHITNLRTALDGVYDAQGKTQPTYTDPTITVGQTLVKKAHIEEIEATLRLWSDTKYTG